MGLAHAPTILPKLRKFRLNIKWNSDFSENPFGKCALLPEHSPVYLFTKERLKLRYHLLNSPVSSLLSTETILETEL